MLKRRVLVMFLVMLMLALPVVAAAASHVEFKDDNLKATVAQEFENLGKVYLESKVPQADMKILKKLYAFGPAVTGQWAGGENLFLDGADREEKIRDLSGLEYALNLEALDLSFNYIKDLAPIRNLQKLRYLNIQGNDDFKYENNNWEFVWDPFNNIGTFSSISIESGTPAFSYNPSSTQMRILQEIQHQGAVVDHDGLIRRISGPDRYETAVRIWQNMYTVGFHMINIGQDDANWVMDYTPGNTIVLARGDDFADALVGAPLAFALGATYELPPGIMVPPDSGITVPAPILLTTSNKLHPATKSALVDYVNKFEDELTADPFNGVFDVYVLGGTDAISEGVVNELIYAIETEYDALDVRAVRIGGEDRYETSVKIAKKINNLLNEDWAEIIFATGEAPPDALAAAPYAAGVDYRPNGNNFENGYSERPFIKPILLTRGNALPDSVVDYLKDYGRNELEGSTITDAVVAGGAAAVSEDVISELYKLKYRFGGDDVKMFPSVTRVWGADRYATAVELGKHYGTIGEDDKIIDAEVPIFEETFFEDGLFYIATGEDFADALTGAVLAAQNGTGILLVKQDTLPSVVADVMNFQSNRGDYGDYTSVLTILGGENAVSLYNAVKMYNLVRYPAWAPR